MADQREGGGGGGSRKIFFRTRRLEPAAESSRFKLFRERCTATEERLRLMLDVTMKLRVDCL